MPTDNHPETGSCPSYSIYHCQNSLIDKLQQLWDVSGNPGPVNRAATVSAIQETSNEILSKK